MAPDDALRPLAPELWVTERPLRAIPAPSRVHHLYVGEWKQAFPEAALLGAPGLAATRKDLSLDGELGDTAHPSFAGGRDALRQAYAWL